LSILETIVLWPRFLAQVSQYDGKGQRVVKNAAGAITLFIFDKDGRLIAEADGGGVVQRDYVYFGGRPVALATATEAPAVFYYHVDHLGSPQVLTNQLGTVVWAGDYGVFGEVNLTTNVVESNLRFPGQYYDQETNLHYNYFRDYDPAIGRYITSDPIGLAGGINTYVYVENNPLNFIDSLGLNRGRINPGLRVGSSLRNGPTLRNDASISNFHQNRTVEQNYRDFLSRMQRRNPNDIRNNQDARTGRTRDLDNTLRDLLPDRRVAPDSLRDTLDDLGCKP